MICASVTRFGPDPSSCYYKLDERLLWHEGLEPLPKLLLIDFFHRERKDEPVPPIGERARRLGVSYDSVARAEERLEADGYLLRGQRAGKACRYVAAFPPVPIGDPRRADFQELLERVLAVPDPLQNAVTHLPQNHGATSRKMLEPLRQNAGGSANHSLLGGTKKKEEKDPPTPHPAKTREPVVVSSPNPEPPAAMPDGTPRLTAEQLAAVETLTSKACRAQTLNSETLRQYRQLFAAGLTVATLTEIVQETLDKGEPAKQSFAYFLPACQRAVEAGRRPKADQPRELVVSTPENTPGMLTREEMRELYRQRDERIKARKAERATRYAAC